MRILHVVSDISVKRSAAGRLRAVGAYSIDGAEPVSEDMLYRESVSAEIECCAIAIYEARRWDSQAEIIAHIDVDRTQLQVRLKRGKDAGALLSEAIALTGAVVQSDARGFPRYADCHRAARGTLGCTAPKQYVKKVETYEQRVDRLAIKMELRSFHDGISLTDLAVRMGMPAGKVHKVLSRLKSLGMAWREMPADQLARCDMTQHIWYPGPEPLTRGWGESLGSILKAAGIGA